jgi:hypothetical protein
MGHDAADQSNRLRIAVNQRFNWITTWMGYSSHQKKQNSKYIHDIIVAARSLIRSRLKEGNTL